jgi:hypothetical protein
MAALEGMQVWIGIREGQKGLGDEWLDERRETARK